MENTPEPRRTAPPYCPNCATPVLGDQRFCPNCGTPQWPQRGASAPTIFAAIASFVAILVSVLAFLLAGLGSTRPGLTVVQSPEAALHAGRSPSLVVPESAHAQLHSALPPRMPAPNPNGGRPRELAAELAPDYETRVRSVGDEGKRVEIAICPRGGSFTNVLHFEWDMSTGEYRLVRITPLPPPGE